MLICSKVVTILAKIITTCGIYLGKSYKGKLHARFDQGQEKHVNDTHERDTSQKGEKQWGLTMSALLCVLDLHYNFLKYLVNNMIPSQFRWRFFIRGNDLLDFDFSGLPG
jgi:hypothetical protein